MGRILRKLAIVMCVMLAVSLPSLAVDLDTANVLIESKQLANIEAVIADLTSYLADNPEDGHANWVIAKAYLYLGNRVSEDVLETFQKGKEYADRAVELVPTSPDAFFWQASLIGCIGQTRGILQSLFMVRPMKDALDRALELDENYADAYHVLSMLYEQAPGFPLSIGNKKLALETARKAVELAPDNIEYPIQLARALNHNNRRSEAVEVLEELLSRPAIEQDLELKAEAEELLAEWKR